VYVHVHIRDRKIKPYTSEFRQISAAIRGLSSVALSIRIFYIYGAQSLRYPAGWWRDSRDFILIPKPCHRSVVAELFFQPATPALTSRNAARHSSLLENIVASAYETTLRTGAQDKGNESKIEMKQNGSSEGRQCRVSAIISLRIITLSTITLSSSSLLLLKRHARQAINQFGFDDTRVTGSMSARAQLPPQNWISN